MKKSPIEKKRLEMHKLAQKYGISASQVLKKSKELDQLLNTYYSEQSKDGKDSKEN
ncbi:aspartyl-phosphate phosphatase Spo0E family protein [Paenibacillus senegalimassiliensis]|uniref:aspartyl-phosphate phosphatase Spo0E family protein n=1 Tax=Paenibacillus senegalimassiliensis TaxID=1737426 RepID=UPI0009E81434|nr:aspartyl-phosphate phosphatase Spo0E family protein [Paenibacillus senegalimassiliensis]